MIDEYSISTGDSTFTITGKATEEQAQVTISITNSATKRVEGIVLTVDDVEVLHAMLSRARQAAWAKLYANQQKGNIQAYGATSPPRNYA